LKAAIDWHFKRLVVASPQMPVAVIAFNSDLLILGHNTKVTASNLHFLNKRINIVASQDEIVITGDHLDDYEHLLSAGRKLDVKGFKPISESVEFFKNKMKSIEVRYLFSSVFITFQGTDENKRSLVLLHWDLRSLSQWLLLDRDRSLR